MSLRTFLKPTPLTFLRRTHVFGTIYSYHFKPNQLLNWHAGQHGMLEVKLPNGTWSRRMFSLSSAPSESEVTVTTHWLDEQASDYKKALWDLKHGDIARLRGPVGPMYIRSSDAHNILIAGGIGITPFRSMLMEAAIQGRDIDATLIYVNRDAMSVPFRHELDEIAEQLPGVSVYYIFNPKKITSRDIERASGPHQDTVYYLSGPPKMIRAYRAMLRSLGTSRSHIKSDPFLGYK